MGVFEKSFKISIENYFNTLGPSEQKRVINKKTPITAYPLATEQRYAAEIRKEIFKPVNEYYKNRVIPNITRWVREENIFDERTDEFESEFESLQAEMEVLKDTLMPPNPESSQFFWTVIFGTALAILVFNRKQFEKQSKQVTGFKYVAPEGYWDSIRNQWMRENYMLIRNLLNLIVSQSNEAIYRGVRNSFKTKQIIANLKEISDNIAKNRVNLVAMDQTGKLNSRITKNRQVEVGIDFYVWHTARDEKVRASHSPLDGKLCKWRDNSVYAEIPKAGEKIKWLKRPKSWVQLPAGEDIDCRCTSTPYFPELLDTG